MRAARQIDLDELDAVGETFLGNPDANAGGIRETLEIVNLHC
jgi:hypothetical protein